MRTLTTLALLLAPLVAIAIAAGDSVEVEVDPTRQVPVLTEDGDFLGRQGDGSSGTVTGGPEVVRKGLDHWRVDFESGPDGWIQENRLTVSGSAPTPSDPPLPGQPPMPSGGTSPNIVLILADDVGIEAFGSYGGQSYQTPNLDQLANNGLRFSHMYSTALCTPTRNELMTGKVGSRNYIGFGLIKPGQTTFGHMMQNSGYQTGIFGKWQLDKDGKGMGSCEAGFDTCVTWHEGSKGSRYRDPKLSINGQRARVFNGKYGPDLLVQHIEDFMTANRNRKFFVYYPMVLPHAPFQPTPLDKEYGNSTAENTKYFASYMKYIDKLVGRIESKVNALGLKRETLILFLSDNGTHRTITSVQNGRRVKGGKGHPTARGTHVPLIASWPGTISGGRVSNELVGLTDFLPTLVDLGGGSLPSRFVTDGVSFASILEGKPGPRRDHIFTYYNPQHGGWAKAVYAFNQNLKLFADGRLVRTANDAPVTNPTAAERQVRDFLRSVLNRYPK